MQANDKHWIVDRDTLETEAALFIAEANVAALKAKLETLKALKDKLPKPSDDYQAPTISMNRGQRPQRPGAPQQ